MGRMQRSLSFFITASILLAWASTLLAGWPENRRAEPPYVQVYRNGHELVFDLPQGTIRDSFWFCVQDKTVPKSLLRGRVPAVWWRGDRWLVADMYMLKRRLRLEEREIDHVSVWGQLEDGTALFQEISLRPTRNTRRRRRELH